MMAATVAEEQPAPAGKAAWAALAVTCFGIFLAALDQTAVSALLPVIVKDFEGSFTPSSVERAGWLVTGYLIGYTVVMPVMGRLADLFGHRRLFNLSILIFMLGSVLCALSPGIGVMSVFRAVAAVGGGAIVPIAMGMVGYDFSRRQQAMALGLLVAAGEAGGVIGPLYGAVIADGAWLVDPIGWRWVFWINIPLGLMIMAAVRLLAPRHPRRRVSVDYRGALLLAALLGVVTVGLSGQHAVGWYNFTLPMLAAGVVLLALFILAERRREHPVVRLDMFRNRSFTAANTANFLEGIALITALVQVPFFAYATRDATPIEGGLMVIRMTLMIPVGAVLAGFLVNRLSHRFTAAAGFAIAATGLFLVSRWPEDASNAVITRDLLITGFGFGFNSPALAAAVVGSISRARAAAGSALHVVFKTTGEMVGLAALGGWGIYQFEGEISPTEMLLLGIQGRRQEIAERSMDAILMVLNRFFLVAAAMCALAALVSLLINVRREENLS